jgi:hypothetical protein
VLPKQAQIYKNSLGCKRYVMKADKVGGGHHQFCTDKAVLTKTATPHLPPTLAAAVTGSNHIKKKNDPSPVRLVLRHRRTNTLILDLTDLLERLTANQSRNSPEANSKVPD